MHGHSLLTLDPQHRSSLHSGSLLSNYNEIPFLPPWQGRQGATCWVSSLWENCAFVSVRMLGYVCTVFGAQKQSKQQGQSYKRRNCIKHYMLYFYITVEMLHLFSCFLSVLSRLMMLWHKKPHQSWEGQLKDRRLNLIVLFHEAPHSFRFYVLSFQFSSFLSLLGEIHMSPARGSLWICEDYFFFSVIVICGCDCPEWQSFILFLFPVYACRLFNKLN